jgi:hypothetical protein
VTYITRTPDHHYGFDGVMYPGTTGILKVLDKSGPLMAWASRMTAEAAVGMAPTLAQLVETVGQEGAVKALTARSAWKNETARDLGTEIHGYADLIAQGKPLPAMLPDTLKRVDGYEQWLRTSGWQIRCSEGRLVNVTKGYGGTLDLLAYDRDGATVLADIKTGNVAYNGKVYESIVLQLAAYGDMEWLDMDDGAIYAMPQVDRYAVIHVTADGTTEIPVVVGQAEREAFMACIQLDRWLQSRKRRAS